MGGQPNMTSDLVKRERMDTKTAMHRKKNPCEGRDWAMQFHAKGCQKSLKTKGQAEGSCPSKCSEGIRPVYTLTSDLLPAEL